MRIARRRREGAAVSLVAMIDVLMILLVFFMVTSTYLDLDMVPLAGTGDPAPEAADAAPQGGGARPAHLLIRIDAEGWAHMQGRALASGELSAAITARLEETPDLDVIVLPSGQADVQALARVMDMAVDAGATRLRIVRLGGGP